MNSKNYFIYIVTNTHNTTFYIGVTSNLEKRIFEHSNKLVKSFSKKYNLNKLVYYETTTDINSAIYKEKQLKNWRRKWKEELIKIKNPEFTDLVKNNFTFPIDDIAN